MGADTVLQAKTVSAMLLLPTHFTSPSRQPTGADSALKTGQYRPFALARHPSATSSESEPNNYALDVEMACSTIHRRRIDHLDVDR